MKKYLLLIICFFVNTQCATIFNSGSQSFVAKAQGDVEEVSVEVITPHGSYRSKLPATIVTSTSSFRDTEIVVDDKCFEKTRFKVKKSITPSYWANTGLSFIGLVFSNIVWGIGGVAGLAIDYFDGYMWKNDKIVTVPVKKIDKC